MIAYANSPYATFYAGLCRNVLHNESSMNEHVSQARRKGSGAVNTEREALARELLEMGFCPLGITPETKQPWHAWKDLQVELPTPETVTGYFFNLMKWYLQKHRHEVWVGVLCGRVSGFLEVIDFDVPMKHELARMGKAGVAEGYHAWLEKLAEHGFDELICKLAIAKTPSGGFHVYYRCPEGIDRNLKLTARPATDVERQLNPDPKFKTVTLIETRGEGGLVVCPTSPGYEWVQGDFDCIPVITADERDILLSMARLLDQIPILEQGSPQTTERRVPLPAGDEVSPFEDFDARGTWDEVFAGTGWTILNQRAGGRNLVRRPGKSDGVSGTIGPGNVGQVFLPYTTSTEFQAGRGYKPATAFCMLHHSMTKEGWSAAAEDLRKRGYGSERKPRPAGVIKESWIPEPSVESSSARPNLDNSVPPEPPSDPPEPPEDWGEEPEPEGEGHYFTRDGCTWCRAYDQKGNPKAPKMLANFTAEIVEQVSVIDGSEDVPSKRFKIRALVEGRTFNLDVAARDFDSMRWVLEQLGARASLAPGHAVRSEFRAAIQALSKPTDTESFAHTGWISRGRVPVYLSGRDAVGPDGLVPGIVNDLEGSLKTFGLAAPPWDPKTAMDASMEILDVFDGALGFTLLSSAYLAPLCSLFESGAPPFCVALFGQTGTFKTEAAFVALSHFGNFRPAKGAPASFRDTPNAIERVSFDLKDSLMVVDDFHPAGHAALGMNSLAVLDILLRDVGNRKAKNRMRADLTSRKAFPPRAMVLLTAEMLPNVQSSMARMFAVEISKGQILPSELQTLQTKEYKTKQQGAMWFYLQYLANDIVRTREMAEEALETAMKSLGEAGFRRQPTQVGYLIAGFRMFLAARIHYGLMSADEAKRMIVRAMEAFRETVEANTEELNDATPVNLFRAALRSAFQTGSAFVTNGAGGYPVSHAESFGWFQGPNGLMPRPGAINVGWLVREENFEMQPDVLYSLVLREVEKMGRPGICGARQLWDQLIDQGAVEAYTEPKTGRRRFTWRTKRGGVEHQVLRLNRSWLFGGPDQAELDYSDDGED